MLENLDPNIHLNFTQIHRSIYRTVISFNTEFFLKIQHFRGLADRMAWILLTTYISGRTELSSYGTKAPENLGSAYCQGDLNPQSLGDERWIWFSSFYSALKYFYSKPDPVCSYHTLVLKPFLLNPVCSEEKLNAWKTTGLVSGTADSALEQEVEAECL